MDIHDSSESVEANKAISESRLTLVKKFWHIFLIQSVVSISRSGLMLNMLGISNVIWPGESFHSVELGVIVSTKMLAVAITGIFYGILADKYSRKNLFGFVLILMGFGKFMNGFVPLYNSQFAYILFIVWYGIFGIGQGGINPLISSYSNDACEFDVRSRFFGLKEVFNQFFIIIGMIVSAWLIQVGLWRIYFWYTGILLIVCGFFIFFVIKEPKRGAMREELKSILSVESISYKYKLNKKTIKSTIFSKSNILIFIEGIFTWILFSIAIYLIYPYIQSPPYNVSPVVSSIMMVIFGVPGAIFGAISFSRISDKLAQKNVKYRVYLIVFSLLTLFGIVMSLFIVPLPQLSIEEANNLFNLFKYPIFVVFGILLFILRAVLGIYNINQTPLIQIVNLPEAQGTIYSWNQFLEELGYGIGPLISGYLLSITNGNYVQTALFSMSLGIPAIFMWLLVNMWINKDIERIKKILEKRAEKLKNFQG
ncbi:MAG: MFS transporter [Candidatus Helarchaeota archaeon]